MFGYIYKTTDLSNGKIYVGKHHSNKFVGLDYIGSGLIISNIRNKCLKEGINLADRFTVEMLDSAETLEELNDKEIYWINYLNARNPEIGYNLRKGGDCGPGGPMFKGHSHSKETKKMMSYNRKGPKNANYGNHWTATEEQKKHYSDAVKGSKNPRYGKEVKQSTRDKIGKANTNRYIGWRKVNNGVEEKMIPPEKLQEYLDNGYSLGMMKYKRKIK